MDNKGNAQSEAFSIRAVQDRKAPSQNDSSRKRGAGSDGKEDGNIGGGNVGATRERSASGVSISGGILAQLITDAQNQLGKMEACIEWYETERAEQLERLENLKKLQQLAEESQDA